MAAAAARVFRGCRFLMSPAAAGVKKPAAAAAAAAPKVTRTDAAEAKTKRGIMQPLPVSDALRRFAGGTPEISRAIAVKLIWSHIKANGLQMLLPHVGSVNYCKRSLQGTLVYGVSAKVQSF
ncbi:hypothetical protein ABZP36_032319 [Zizania latifolia]